MKMYKNILITVTMFSFLIGCDLEYFPTDQLSDETVKNSPELLSNLTIGTYSRIRGTNYMRLRHFLQELPGDELAWCKNSGDHICNAYSYNRLVNSNACSNFWKEAYYGIFQANKIIEAVDDNAAQTLLQLKGENLFLRAFMNYDLVRLFSRPYSQNPEENPKILLMDKSDANTLAARSTVKESYEFIVNDLLKAADLMQTNKSNIFASKEVAWALLARMYLYMEQNDKAIEYADKVINSGRYELVPTEELSDYYTLLPETNPETIFAIKCQSSENLGKSGIGSLYTKEGWGEIFVSTTHQALIYKNPNDERLKFVEPDYILDAGGNKIPDLTEACGYRVVKRLDYSKYYNLKYTFQEGIALLSSPVVLRLAEMYLVKAEAYAKTAGKEADAIEMVNIIRRRAGLTGDQLFTPDDLKEYDSILDIVLDERRLELAWEGHRSFDLFRNNRSLDRSFTHNEGWSGSQLILPTSNLIVPYIPEAEITLNPNLIQNPE